MIGSNRKSNCSASRCAIKDARMESIPPHHRPFYPPPHRMAILELKAARGWSLEQAAWEFLVTAATIASWLRRIDEDGPNALVQLRQSAGLTPPPTRLSKVAGPGQCSGSVPPRFATVYVPGILAGSVNYCSTIGVRELHI